MNSTIRGEEQELMNLMHAVIGSAFQVQRALGTGFSPEVYRSALRIELENRRVPVAERPSLTVKYQGRIVGEFKPDLLVGDRVVVELERLPTLPKERLEEARRVLEATRVPTGVVLNFGGRKLEYRRVQRAA